MSADNGVKGFLSSFVLENGHLPSQRQVYEAGMAEGEKKQNAAWQSKLKWILFFQVWVVMAFVFVFMKYASICAMI